MFDIEKELKDRGLTEETYEHLLTDCQKKLDKEIDVDWSELCEKYSLDWNGDSLRKGNISLVGGAFVKQYYEEKMAKNSSINEDEYLKKLEEKKREIEKEKVKLRTEKNEYNKWLREDARNELIVEQIINSISNLDPIFIPEKIELNHNDREYLLCFGDEHFGAEFEIKDLFGNIINSYSPEEFEKRMNYLLYQVIEIVQKENIDILNIYSLGDFADGILRTSQLMKLRYGIVDSTIKYAEYISNWLNELSNFVKIKYQQCAGNHTELRMIGAPKGTFVEDNMDKVVRVFIKERLKNNPNFTMIENPSGMAYSQLCGYTVLGVHGETKNMEKTMNDLSKIYSIPFDYLIAGHLHHSKTETVGIDSEVINVPSVIGIDDYSLSLGKSSNAGATLLVFERLKGKVVEYDIKLN